MSEISKDAIISLNKYKENLHEVPKVVVDPNVYALSISLQLESSDAFSTLEDFGVAAANVEESISTAAQNSLNAISDITGTMGQNLIDSISNTKDLVLAGTQLEQVLTNVTDTIRDAYDIQTDGFDEIEKRLELFEKIKDVQQDIEKSADSEYETGKGIFKTVGSIFKAVLKKNIAHVKEGDLLLEEAHTATKLHKTTNDITNSIKDANYATGKFSLSFSEVFRIIQQFDKETDQFTEANYRAYGSQQRLLNNTRSLSAEYGIFKKEAIETYKVLADLRTPREEIYKLAGIIGRTSHTTGISTTKLGEYSRELRGAGFGADRTRKQINMLSAAQRAFGLSAYDMQNAIKDSNLSMSELVTYFGEDAPEAFMKAKLGLHGAAKELGLDAKAAEDWMKTLQLTGAQAQVVWGGFAKIAGDSTVDEKLQAMSIATKNFLGVQGISMAMLRDSSKLSISQAESLERLSKQFGITVDQLYMMAYAEENLTEVQRKQFFTMGGIENAFEKQLKANGRWSESMNTLTKQLAKFGASLDAVFGFFVQLAADALIPFLKILNSLIFAIGWTIGLVRSIIGWMEAWIPGFHILMNIVRFTAGTLILLSVALLAVGSSAAILSTALSGAATVAASSVNIISTVGNTIVAIAKIIGKSIYTIFAWVGKGLASIGKSIKPVIIPLMQLGVAVALVGAGFFMMGLGLYYAAEHGWAAAGMLVAMTVAMVAMLAAFAVIATIVGPVIPLMIALAAVVLILGGAVMLAGLGIRFIGLAVESLAVHGAAAAAALPALAGGIMLLSLAGFAGYAGLIVLSSGLWLLVVPLALIGPTMLAIVSALRMLSGDAISKFATSLYVSANQIAMALAIMIPIMLILPFIAAGLFAAGIILVVAGTLFSVASMAIGFGAKLLGTGMLLLASGAKEFKGINFINMAWQLMVGGLMLVTAGGAFTIGATLVGAGALLLGEGLQSLGKGAQELDGINFLAIARQLMVGGFWLAIGGTTFSAGAALVGASALILGEGLQSLGKGAKELDDVNFAVISKQLAVGGQYLIAAAIPLMIGATALAASSFHILTAGILIGIGGARLKIGALGIRDSSIMLYQSGDKLIASGTMMIIAGPLLASGALALMVGGSLILPASLILASAALLLLPAAIGIYVGMSWLETAVRRFRGSLGDIKKLGVGLQLFAYSFELLAKAPIDSIGDATDAALAAMPNIKKLARELDKSAEMFQSAADKFVKPVQEIASSLEGLGVAMANIGSQGLMVQDDLDKLGGMLNRYTDLLEGTAQRIELAVVSKAVPAITEARNEGLENIVRSEAITTVQVMNSTEGDAEKTNETTIMMQEQTVLLRSISEKINSVTYGDEEIVAIVGLLEAYLPGLADKKESLSTEFNQWMK